jgi:hypothetical protein
MSRKLQSQHSSSAPAETANADSVGSAGEGPSRADKAACDDGVDVDSDESGEALRR